MSELNVNAEATNYNYGEIITPFQQSGQNWDMPIGYWRNKARIWRMLTITLLTASILLIAIFLADLFAPQHTIYASSISENGYVKSFGVLTDDYVIPAAMTEQFLQKYIQALFSKQGLSGLVSKNASFVLDFSSDTVDSKFKQLVAEETQADLSYPVVIQNIQLLSDNTFKATWQRQHTDSDTGKVIGHSNYEGEFVVDFVTPDSPGLIQQNPLGYFIQNAKWKLINGTANGQEK